jgi:hypothetical protein
MNKLGQTAVEATQQATKQPAAEKETISPTAEVTKRLLKLCTKPAVALKSPTQLLHESCPPVAATATCVQENGTTAEQRFAFKITNILVGESEVAYGYGKRKQDAKNAACKQALWQFFNFDLDRILASAAAVAAIQSGAFIGGGGDVPPVFKSES